MARTGRPPIQMRKINEAELIRVMRLHPSEQQVADWFNTSRKAVERYIRKYFKTTFVLFREKWFTETKLGLKNAQIEKALAGDNTMLIWCGKQYLDQKDKSKLEHSGIDGQAIQIKDVTKLTNQELESEIQKLLLDMGLGLPKASNEDGEGQEIYTESDQETGSTS